MEREELSLFELNNRIKGIITNSFANTYWVRAEMSDVRCNSSGHCYLEFIEKDSATNQLIAKSRASIWAKTFRMLKPYFEMETKQLFTSGLKVLVKVTVTFHELYGFSLNVLDIDPAYTVGDMQRKRLEIINRLKEEGVFFMNKELPFPTLPKRIAIISSPTAAGYEDFMEQLTWNKAGYPFYTKLFPAVMQGDRTESSIIEALDHIYRHIELFDVLVIIRGGGATSDLNCFDSYLLALNCAQFPLPIITGIGHERDDTILDMVAHTRLKTPTAVAEYLIGIMDKVAEELNYLQQAVISLTSNILLREMNGLQALSLRLPAIITGRIEQNRLQLHQLQDKLRRVIDQMITENNSFIQLTEQYIKMASPQYILKRGYSLTLKNGEIVKNISAMAEGEEITTRFYDGELKSKVYHIKEYNEDGRNI